jgi:hypothetical protein
MLVGKVDFGVGPTQVFENSRQQVLTDRQLRYERKIPAPPFSIIDTATLPLLARNGSGRDGVVLDSSSRYALSYHEYLLNAKGQLDIAAEKVV